MHYSFRTGLLLTLTAVSFFALGRWRAGQVGGRGTITEPSGEAPGSTSDGGLTAGISKPDGRNAGHKLAGIGAGLPEGAARLLRSLDSSGSLGNQIAILQYARSLDPAAARAVAQTLTANGKLTDRNINLLSSAVFRRWAEQDPHGILQSAKSAGSRYFGMRAMEAGFAVLAARSPAAAWDAASGFGASKVEAQRSVIAALTDTNPQVAFDLIRTHKKEGFPGLSDVMSGWAEKDPAAAAAATLSLPTDQRYAATEGLMSKWAVTDFAAASAWVSSMPEGREKNKAMTMALESLAFVDPDKSLRILRSCDIGKGRHDVVGTAIQALARKDFDSALKQAASFGNYLDQASALSALSGCAAGEDREKLLRLAASLPDRLAERVFSGDFWSRAYDNSSDMIAAVGKISEPSVREHAMGQLVDQLSSSDPAQAASLYDKLKSTSRRSELLDQISGGLAWREDPQKAMEWAQTLTTEAERKVPLTAAITAQAMRDTGKLAGLLAQVQNSDTRLEIVGKVAETLCIQKPGEASQWMDTLSGGERTAALGHAIEVAAGFSPERVPELYAKFTASLSPEDAARSENQGVARTVATQLAQDDVTKAAAWSLALPEGGSRDQAVAGVVSIWAGYDSAAASEWLRNLPQGQGRDLAAGNLVSTIANDDPESAWAWASSISDNARRREAAAAALAGWKANGNRAAAQAALDAGGFSEADYQELRRKLE
jgi:hypothetical protein